MKRILCILLLICLLLGCSRNADPTDPTTEPTAAPTQPTEETTSDPTEAPSEDPSASTEPSQTPLAYRNPLNGTPIDHPWTARPFAVVINNIRYAMPQQGVSQADKIFEILADGGITRCLALFSDLSQVEKLGSLRSARTYLIDLAQAHDAILIHVGGSSYALEQLKSGAVTHINALVDTSSTFYRDKDRLNAGYAYEHTLFSSGPALINRATKWGCTMTRDSGISYNYTFAEEIQLEGEVANTVKLTFRRNGKVTTMTYDPDTGLYTGAQFNETYIDGNDGSAMTFRNVLVLYAEMTSKGERVFHKTVGEGDGYFACGGVIVPIKWSRANNGSSFVFTLLDGTPVTLGVGHSYIGIVPFGSIVSYE